MPKLDTMASSQIPSAECPDYSKIVEFGVWPTPDGWAGRHRFSGREVQADTLRRLELLACAVRIGYDLHRAIPRR